MTNNRHNLTTNFMGQVFDATTNENTGWTIGTSDRHRNLNDVLTEIRRRMDQDTCQATEQWQRHLERQNG